MIDRLLVKRFGEEDDLKGGGCFPLLEVLCHRDKALAETFQKKTNIHGGAIVIGHPNTASGATILMTLIYELRRRGGGRVASISEGDGATVQAEGRLFV